MKTFRINGTFTGEITPDPRPEIMFLTHAPWDNFDWLCSYLLDKRFDISRWNYCFLDFPVWGDYFNLESSDKFINDFLGHFSYLGFRNILYVDVTECHISIKERWSDCILETGDWWALLDLDPEKSWYQHLKAGMLGYIKRFGSQIVGFALDRIDRCRDGEQLDYCLHLLNEIQTESGRSMKYVMNTLQGWQERAAMRASFIGSDGVNVQDIDGAINHYSRLAEYTEENKFYLVGDPANPEHQKQILEKHNFTFVDDYNLGNIEKTL